MKHIKLFVVLIVVIGVIRFVLSVSGAPDNLVKFASMSVIIGAAALYYAITCPNLKERLKLSFVLILPYMIIEVLALGYSWVSGHQTIFHAQEYSFGSGIMAHTIGHFVGGLTWEPLSMFVVMEIVWFIYAGGRRLLHANP